jgi:hypothetical protein
VTKPWRTTSIYNWYSLLLMFFVIDSSSFLDVLFIFISNSFLASCPSSLLCSSSVTFYSSSFSCLSHVPSVPPTSYPLPHASSSARQKDAGPYEFFTCGETWNLLSAT